MVEVGAEASHVGGDHSVEEGGDDSGGQDLAEDLGGWVGGWVEEEKEV